MTREEAIYCMEAYLSDDSHKHCIKCKYYKENCCQLSKAHIMAIKALKEQETGEWEYIQYDANQNIGNWHCSKCRHIITMNIVPYYKYCPYCGAKMEVKEWYYI